MTDLGFNDMMRRIKEASDEISRIPRWMPLASRRGTHVEPMFSGTNYILQTSTSVTVSGAPLVPVNTRETKMDRKTVIKSRMAKLEAELAELERFPEDTFEDGTVITFERKIKHYAAWHVYKYAAIKVGGWYVTGGGSAQNVTWEKLTEWLSDSLDDSVWVMRRDHKIVGTDDEKTTETESEKTGELDKTQQGTN